MTDLVGKDFPRHIDIMTYSFPCTDLSKAGKQKGLNNTRSGLVYEVLRILAELKDIDNRPKVLIMENVVDLVQSKFIKQFNEIQLELEGLGYTNYVQKLNAKNYGIAQNRDRVFMVSVLGEFNYNFPKPFALRNRLVHYLEENVDEKFYLTEKQMRFLDDTKYRSMSIDSVHSVDGICKTLDTMRGGNREPKIFEPMISYALGSREHKTRGWLEISPTLCARDYKDPKVIIEPVCLNSVVNGKQPSLQDRVYDSTSIATAITTSFHPSYTEPQICAQRGRNPQKPKSREVGLETVQMIEVGPEGLSNTLTTVQKDNYLIEPVILQKKRGYNKGSLLETCPSITSSSWNENNCLVIQEETEKGFDEACTGDSLDLEKTNSEKRSGSIIKSNVNDLTTSCNQDVAVADGLYTNDSPAFFRGSLKDLSRTIKTNDDCGVIENGIRIRKLTPTETGRLMGINDYR
ncbi:DNA cytosine methyltransferase [Erysipelothrix sp. D19-032]